MIVLSRITFKKLQKKFEAAQKAEPPKKMNILFNYQVGGIGKQKEGWIIALSNDHITNTNTICFEFTDNSQVSFSHSKCTSIILLNSD